MNLQWPAKLRPHGEIGEIVVATRPLATQYSPTVRRLASVSSHTSTPNRSATPQFRRHLPVKDNRLSLSSSERGRPEAVEGDDTSISTRVDRLARVPKARNRTNPEGAPDSALNAPTRKLIEYLLHDDFSGEP